MSKKKSIPNHVMILGKKVKITFTDLEDDQGKFNRDDLEITIDISTPPNQLKTTLIHECIHAILDIGGMSYRMGCREEEAFVRLLESGLEDLITFKP